MFYKIGVPKYSEAPKGGALQEKVFLNTFWTPFVTEHLRWLLLNVLLNSRDSNSARGAYFIKFQHLSMQLYEKRDSGTYTFLWRL